VSEAEVVVHGIFEPISYRVPYSYAQMSGEQTLELSALLSPGYYGVIFGSGLYGATGSGWMASTDQQTYTVDGIGRSIAIGSPDYFFWSEFGFGIPPSWTDRGFGSGGGGQARFFVNGETVVPTSPVPEPATFTLALAGLLAVGFRLWRRDQFAGIRKSCLRVP
jgi:hypothetical protein